MTDFTNNINIWIIIILLMVIIFLIYFNYKLNKSKQELLEEKGDVEKAIKTKSNFIANISHEIRTPMNSIVGMTYLIQETKLSPIQKDYITNIESASNNMLHLINQILDFSKLESNTSTVNMDVFSLSQLLNDIDNIVRYKAYNKELDFSIVYDKYKHLYVYSDCLKLLQILTNVISNAIKFTNSGFVELSITEVSPELFQFRVQDSGIGLSEKQIKSIFIPFTQADESTTRHYGGTGLGLSISKELVTLLGGKIWVNSVLHKGSEFIIELPLKITNQTLQNIDNMDTLKNDIQENKESKPMIKEKEFQILFTELKNAVSKRRPNLCEPIISKLNKYKLKSLDQAGYDKVVKLIKQYKFSEAKELFDEE